MTSSTSTETKPEMSKNKQVRNGKLIFKPHDQKSQSVTFSRITYQQLGRGSSFEFPVCNQIEAFVTF